jgi:large subunit ribosomal protein L3
VASGVKWMMRPQRLLVVSTVQGGFMKGLLGRKLGMTQLLSPNGEVIPVTVIEAGPCYVTQIKSDDTDGYAAVQLGFDETREKRLTKGQVGHLRRKSVPFLRILREFRTKSIVDYTVGQKILADVFSQSDRVDVAGVSKGRGFQGGVRRHGFHGGPKTHGQSDRLRGPGAIGSGTTPGRVYKGTRMAGHMGNAHITVSNLLVALVDPERNLLAVRGSVPGPKGGLLVITEARKQR